MRRIFAVSLQCSTDPQNQILHSPWFKHPTAPQQLTESVISSFWVLVDIKATSSCLQKKQTALSLQTAGKILVTWERGPHLTYKGKQTLLISHGPVPFLTFPNESSPVLCGGIFPDRQTKLKLKVEANRSLKSFSVWLRISMSPTRVLLAGANLECSGCRKVTEKLSCV